MLAQLKSALYRMNIVFEDRHFETLMAKIDADGSGTISYKEFMKYFAKGSADDSTDDDGKGQAEGKDQELGFRNAPG